MAAGLGFKTFVTGEVLTAADTNGYLMQGVNVFADATARSAAITSPQEGQMSYLKDTNSTEYYSGSAWVAVGAAGGAFTLLSTTTLSGASTTISSINQTYKNLYFVAYGVNLNTAGEIRVAPNNDTSNSKGSVTYNGTTGGFNGYLYLITAAGNSDTGGANVFSATFNDYAATTYRKTLTVQLGYVSGGATVQGAGGGYFNSTSAISSLVFSTNQSFTGGTVLLYGEK